MFQMRCLLQGGSLMRACYDVTITIPFPALKTVLPPVATKAFRCLYSSSINCAAKHSRFDHSRSIPIASTVKYFRIEHYITLVTPPPRRARQPTNQPTTRRPHYHRRTRCAFRSPLRLYPKSSQDTARNHLNPLRHRDRRRRLHSRVARQFTSRKSTP